MKITSEQQGGTEIERERRVYLIRWEFLVQKEEERKHKGMKRERIILVRFRRKTKGNRFQSRSSLSLRKYAEKSLMGRKETEPLFRCWFMDS